MKILIELPTWLGDAVMSTPALEHLYNAYPDAEITLVGSHVAIEALKAHPRVTQTMIDRTKSGGFRPMEVYRLAKEIGPHDLALSFRSHFYSRLLMWLTRSKEQYLFNKQNLQLSPTAVPPHQVEQYQAFINTLTHRQDAPGPLRLDWPVSHYKRPTLGINPGASYGSAKRWYPDRFAEVGTMLADQYAIVIFGGPGETTIAADIETALRSQGVRELRNLAGKTSVSELCSAIGGLDLFLTGDSGPMHIAAAYRVPTVAIFGPTDHRATSQWMNNASRIVRRQDLECAPCMKRTCPLKHHACMKEIDATAVLSAVKKICPDRDSSG